ncbi:fumarylacetoacetate hydrolase family protein [Leucobacter sp. UT-8R-CII-1-4]|uniref:fumarylacetoacetate hydrolase family protein n=1 Tax=Leucobacter sp. UT-8R-CII-1-4 TaxID=3040075 RepID=UPI0024A8719C|nr:fumarylacetoacetate hydrolase family protein [Leucobacter sp. UT-8R-CII-1-4]MDI6023686.1 fumarylacetoacetate hydrolase family protein [Leucobacter sp. UT-8R-CII-1-4]
MRIARIQTSEGPRLAVQQDERWLAAAPAGVTLPQMLARGAAFKAEGPELEGEVLAPLIPGKIVAIGLNYMDHIREAQAEVPKAPLVFTKFPSSVTGPDSDVVIDQARTQRVDWEVELALVIGKRAQHVQIEEAMDYVFGYTIANDISARDMQFGDGQWVRGKSQDTFCPLGPTVVTADEVANPGELALSTRVNDVIKQDSNTRELIFGLAELVAYCSQNFTLEPGDVILSGTPWGCGEFMTPAEHLQPGDIVECRIEGLGSLRNTVIAA